MQLAVSRSFHNVRWQQGFSLVEMAIVLVIAATLVTMGLGALNAQLLSSNYSTTKKRQEAVKDALINYFGANHRLPCPNNPATGTLIDGNEVLPTLANGRCVPKFGVLPYATLGLPRSAAEDGWGNLFSYQVYDDSGTPPTCPGTGVSWGYQPCFGTGKSGGITVNEGTTSIATVVAIVISHGANGLGGWVVKGTQNAQPTQCEEAHNALFAGGCALTANTFYKGEHLGNDDVLAYLTANDIVIPLAKQESIKSATAQVAEDLETLKYEKIAAKQTASCAGSVAGNFGTDPWGSPYKVLEGPLSASYFPICVCSTMGLGAAPIPTAASCNAALPTTCQTITKGEFNAYLIKAGSPTCP